MTESSSPKRSKKVGVKRARKRDAAVAAQQPAAPETFPVVGIGASAGGLEAVSELLRHLPSDTGMAFVLVQHLAPGHTSMLSELVAKETDMPVLQAGDGMTVRPNHVYVMPPGAGVAILGGALHLMPRNELRERHLPVDYFLRSLAEEVGPQAIGIVLSGTGSDGTLGLQEIKAAGGITFAQDERSAKYTGMPRSAVASGSVDLVMPPRSIAEELGRIRRHPYVAPTWVAEDLAPEDRDPLNKIFVILRDVTGVDFSYYKLTTIQRRVRRRLLLHKLERLADYAQMLLRDRDEVQTLYQDLLIKVTGFFREPPVFESFAKLVFPRLLKDRPQKSPLRVWVPACSTGEEAYSIAMALLEYAGQAGLAPTIQMFATDVDETAIVRARTGIYPENIAADVSPERLKRFFLKTDGGYQISKAVRDLCIFARQDITRDPPFSKLDLISCRNVLIYLSAPVQKRILPIFHYALSSGGFLVLGGSESVGPFPELFELVDAKAKIYEKKPGVTHLRPEFLSHGDLLGLTPPGQVKPQDKSWSATAVEREADRIMLGRYAPAGLVVNQDLEVLLFRGQSGPYLEPPPGEASLNLLKLVRPTLVPELRSLLHKSMNSKTTTRREGLSFRENGAFYKLNLVVVPFHGLESGETYYLVVFERAKAAPPEAEKAARARPAKGKHGPEAVSVERVEALEQELAMTRDYLQANVEELEATNEELRSANEEIQSANEELQSMNEELETAKEELQSTNEELETVNDELEGRNEELTRLNNDLNNLLASVNIPIVMLGRDLRIRRFTPRADKLLNLIPTDVGRPLSDIKPNIDIPHLDQLVSEVIEQVSVRQMHIQDREGHWFLLRVHPYRTSDNRIDGAVIAIVDIHDLKTSLQALEAARDYTESIVAALKHPLLVLDSRLRVISASRSFLETFRLAPEHVVDQPLSAVGEGEWADPKLRAHIEKAFGDGAGFEDVIMERSFGGAGHRRLSLTGRRIPPKSEREAMLLLEINDLTSSPDPAPGSEHGGNQD